MYQTCIFDLYGTLVDIHTEEDRKELWEKLALFYGYYGAFYTGEELRDAYKRLTKEMSEGSVRLRTDSHEAYPELQIEQVFLRLFAERGIDAGMELAVHAGQFFRVLSTDYIRLYEGTKEMLAAVKRAGKKIYLLSNAQRIFTEYEMKALDIFRFFDGIFISSDHGCKKPDIRFFRALLEKYSILADTAVMVGNDGICDMEGAKKAGLATLYIHSNLSPDEENVEADHVQKQMDMREIAEILTKDTADGGGFRIPV